MNDNWVSIYKTTESHKISLAQGILNDAGIKSTILNKQDSMYLNFNTTLPIELFVTRTNAVKAIQILKNKEL